METTAHYDRNGHVERMAAAPSRILKCQIEPRSERDRQHGEEEGEHDEPDTSGQHEGVIDTDIFGADPQNAVVLAVAKEEAKVDDGARDRCGLDDVAET